MTMPFSPCDPAQPTCDDVTVQALESIFGPVVKVLWQGLDPSTVTAASSLLGTLFTFFNSGILVIGSIIVSYVAVLGSVNTANDGEVMGKAWSAPWTTLRMVFGGAVLLPTASGYSFIQLFVLMLSLWSIGFANGVYKLGMGLGVLKPDGIVTTSYQAGSYFGLRDFAKQYLAASYCARSANTIYADGGGSPSVMADGSADKQTVNGSRIDYTFFIKDRNATTNLGGGEPICGTVTLTSYTPSGVYSDTSGTQAALDNLRSALLAQKVSAAVGLMQDIDNWVATMPSDIHQTGWDAVQSSQFNALVKSREDWIVGQIATLMSSNEGTVNAGVSSFVGVMTKGGWSMAGGWYQRVGLIRGKLSTITGESVGNVTSPSLSALPSDARASLLRDSVTTVAETITKKAEQAGNGYSGSTDVKPEDFATLIPKDAKSDINIGSLDADMSTKFQLLLNGLMKRGVDLAVGTGGDVDAVSRMKLTGDLLSSYQAMLWLADASIKTAVTSLRVVVGAVGGVEVLGNKLDMRGVTDPVWDWTMAVPVPIIAKIADSVGYLAFMFGVALPAMPYGLFMIGVVGWMLAVLQTAIAAPLWAIMHMRPSQTFVGSDAQGYLLLMALFVRPALSVIGLFAAMLVADPCIDYIGKAFFAMRGDVVSSTGWVGVLAQFQQFFWWFTAFWGVLLPVMFMIFGLPQVLPDRVLAWLNVGVHDLGASGASAELQRNLNAGGERAGAEGLEGLGGRGGRRRLGGGGGSDNGGGPPPGGGGGRRAPQLLNTSEQGVAPGGGGSGFDGGGGPPSGGGGGARSGSASPRGAIRRSSTRVGEAVGMAAGRLATDSVMAVRDAMADDSPGMAGRMAGNLAGAVRTAGSESVAAFRGGAAPRIANFRSAMAMRAALSGAPSGSGAMRMDAVQPGTSQSFDAGASSAAPAGSGSVASPASTGSSRVDDGAPGRSAAAQAGGSRVLDMDAGASSGSSGSGSAGEPPSGTSARAPAARGNAGGGVLEGGSAPPPVATEE